jgi:hypothetical protein
MAFLAMSNVAVVVTTVPNLQLTCGAVQISVGVAAVGQQRLRSLAVTVTTSPPRVGPSLGDARIGVGDLYKLIRTFPPFDEK